MSRTTVSPGDTTDTVSFTLVIASGALNKHVRLYIYVGSPWHNCPAHAANNNSTLRSRPSARVVMQLILPS